MHIWLGVRSEGEGALCSDFGGREAMVGCAAGKGWGAAGAGEAGEGRRPLAGGTVQKAGGGGQGRAEAAEFSGEWRGGYADDWGSCWGGGVGGRDSGGRLGRGGCARESVAGPGVGWGVRGRGLPGGRGSGGGAALPGRAVRGRLASVRGSARARAREEAPEPVGRGGAASFPAPYVRESGRPAARRGGQGMCTGRRVLRPPEEEEDGGGGEESGGLAAAGPGRGDAADCVCLAVADGRRRGGAGDPREGRPGGAAVAAARSSSRTGGGGGGGGDGDGDGSPEMHFPLQRPC